MLEIINIILWIALALMFIYTVFTIWFERFENYGDKVNYAKIIICSLIVVALICGTYYTQAHISIIEAQAAVKSFEEVKSKKEELGDSYIIEPSVLKDYNRALQTIDKYKSLGVIK